MVVAACTSCASILTRSFYPVDFNSVPQGARLTVENRDGRTVFSGQTPTTIFLEPSAGYMRPERYKITYSRPGQEPVTTYIQARIEGWYFANLALWPVAWIGMLLVDPLTGAMYRIPPGSEVMTVSMGTPQPAPSATPAPPAPPAPETPEAPAASSYGWSRLGE